MKINKLRFGIFIIAVISIIVAIILATGKKYTLVIKDVENIASVVSQKNTSGGKIEVSSRGLILEIVENITSERTTKTKSVNDTPNCEEYYKVTFVETNQVIYVYEKDGQCYIEEPYNGIYEITRDEFDKIMQYLSF
ncbi:MAG: DUF5301 domain-containing protein [Clostridia bacterium]|nr:DUF5301 domain-containing protein [Clostridia bacterium]